MEQRSFRLALLLYCIHYLGWSRRKYSTREDSRREIAISLSGMWKSHKAIFCVCVLSAGVLSRGKLPWRVFHVDKRENSGRICYLVSYDGLLLTNGERLWEGWKITHPKKYILSSLKRREKDFIDMYLYKPLRATKFLIFVELCKQTKQSLFSQKYVMIKKLNNIQKIYCLIFYFI